MFGEVLWPEEDIDGPEFIRWDVDGAQYVERLFNCGDERDVEAVGIKVHYSHARFSTLARKAWDALLRDRDIRVIHLWRKNLLRAYLSLETAHATGQWTLRSEAGRRLPAAPIALEPDQCEAYFARMLAYRLWVNEAFAEHDVLTLEYERDLSDRFELTVAQAFSFIGVQPAVTAKPLVKQATGPIEEAVANYSELRDYFRHTLFARFFAAGTTENRESPSSAGADL